MAIPLTTGNEDAITGMCLCSQQMSTTPHQAVGQLLFLSLGELRRYRQPQMLAQTLNGLI
jgi:hypothetical protein